MCADVLEDRDLIPVANILESISYIGAEIAELDRKISAMCGDTGDYPEAGRLQQIAGHLQELLFDPRRRHAHGVAGHQGHAAGVGAEIGGREHRVAVH